MISIYPFHRKFIAALAVTVAFTALAVGGAQAAAPMVKTSAPAYYRMMLGDFEITALSDGTVALPVRDLLTHITPAQVDKALAKSYLKSPLETSFNGFLVNTGNKLVLIDTGAGNLFGPTLGNLVANLKASGYQPEQVDEIFITHMHPDHVGGLMAGDQRTFPNATVHADQHDVDYWLSQANLDKAPDSLKGFFKGAMASINPYIKAGKFKAFHGATELVPGIKTVAMPGHTPGHTMYDIESKGQKLLVWGDVVHVASVQFANPAIAIQFDVDSKHAVGARKKIFSDAAKQGYLIAGAHLPFPGIGHIGAAGKAYTWIPVNYTPMR